MSSPSSERRGGFSCRTLSELEATGSCGPGACSSHEASVTFWKAECRGYAAGGLLPSPSSENTRETGKSKRYKGLSCLGQTLRHTCFHSYKLPNEALFSTSQNTHNRSFLRQKPWLVSSNRLGSATATTSPRMSIKDNNHGEKQKDISSLQPYWEDEPTEASRDPQIRPEGNFK